MSNKTECYAFTNPKDPDTDMDGCSDGDEINLYASNPLNSFDCKIEEKEKIISISSPQAGWILSDLDITGLAPDTTSIVNLIAFPVNKNEDLSKVEEVISLGSINKFNPSNIEGQYHFHHIPENKLEDGHEYDLVAIGVLVDGTTISSSPIRFSMDFKNVASSPIATFIGDTAIKLKLNLERIQINPSENGKVIITGESEYGAQVFAVWESIVLASSIITDSSFGEFSIESPKAFGIDENHKVTLFAVKNIDGKKIKSKNIDVNFHIKKLSSYYWIILVFIGIIAIMISEIERKNREKRRKSLVNKK